MPQVDFTLEDLKQVFATKDDLGRFATKDDLSAFPSRDDVRGIVREEMAEVKVELRRVKNMLEEDGRAESQVHMADTTVHLRSNHE